MSKEEYEEGFIEFFDGAISEKSQGRHRDAIVLYWKAITQICDYIFYKEKNRAPENLNERLSFFRNGDLKRQKVADILGERTQAGTPYHLYNDTYRNKQSDEECKVMEDAIRDLIELLSIKGAIKDAIKKIQAD